MYNRILSPVDGSATSSRGMLEAIRFARDQNAQLRFVHVVDTYFPIYDLAGDFDIAALTEALYEAGRKILRDAEAAAQQEGVYAASSLVECMGGRVADFVVEQARSWPADIIVMSSHGRRGFSHLILGSTAEAVSRMSPVPVLLIMGMQEKEAAS